LRVRFLKPTFLGLAGGVMLAAVVLAVEIVHAEKSASAQIADCQTKMFSDRTETVCDSAMQFGGAELAVAFVAGFAAAFAWSLRRRSVRDI
jgi:hypothetical protein